MMHYKLIESLIIVFTFAQTSVDEAHQFYLSTEAKLLVAGAIEILMEHPPDAFLGKV